MEKSTHTVRLEYLDALRGIAALIVVFYHYFNWFWKDEMGAKIASLAFNGADAVSFFFVLSGFALSYKYFNLDSKLHYGRFLFKRIFRLYPAYLITILICLAYWLSAPSWAETIQRTVALNYGAVWAEMTMVMNKHQFYIPGWTLAVEMIFSLVVPLIVILAKRNKGLVWFILIGSLVYHPTYNSMFLFHFTLGILIAIYYNYLQQRPWKNLALYKIRWLFIPIIFALYNFRVLERIFTLPQPFRAFNSWARIDFSHYSAIATAIVIVLIIMSQFWQRILKHPILLYLGKISYGIYLMHWVFVLAVMEHYETLVRCVGLPEWIGFSLFLILVVAATLGTADLLYRHVEAPIIKGAKRVTSPKMMK